MDRTLRVSHPFAESLTEKGKGWDKKKDQPALWSFLFSDFQCGKGFARSACHDQLATVVVPKVLMTSIQGSLLVPPKGFPRMTRCCTAYSVVESHPIHGGLLQVP
jgi:hypothetical protein